MKGNVTLSIRRKQGESDTRIEQFELEMDSGQSTVLEALQTIQEEVDGTLAIRYGCRFKSCGLCAVNINGNPRMACMTKLKDGQLIEPLNHLPVLKDLVVDRSFVTETLESKNLLIPAFEQAEKMIEISNEFEILSKCTECLSCLSGCDSYNHETRNEVPGPLFFVKLAQMHYHPLNSHDYKTKAMELGAEKYRDSQIPCPYGIPIKKLAIEPFLDKPSIK